MPLPQSVIDWNDADDQANAATRACKALIDAGKTPTDEQFSELVRLRMVATDRMHVMLKSLRKETT